MLRKFCRCGKLIPQTLKMCEECQYKLDRRDKIVNKETYRRYKANRTDIKEQRFYVSKEWIFTRDTVKKRDYGLCKLCERKNKISYVDNVHHIEELKDNWSKRTNLDNLICLCNRCHYYVHKKYKTNEAAKKEMQEKLKELLKG
ncbi:HNH endonuclease [Clostridium baratii]|uniref:HNH endonuclease n=1 Tax=Clostridium baratii TaxID=1561 RepID=UPI003D78F4E6